MGVCGEERIKEKIEEKNEVITGYKPIPLEILNKILKSVCKITKNLKKGIILEMDFSLLFRFFKITFN